MLDVDLISLFREMARAAIEQCGDLDTLDLVCKILNL